MEGLPLDLGHHRLAALDDPLLVFVRSERVLVAEDVEIGLPDQLLDAVAVGLIAGKALADQQEPALEVLEEEAFARSGKEVAKAEQLQVLSREGHV